jgi:general stress protein CsbA
MTRPNAVWLVFLLLGLVFGATAVVLFTTGSVNVFAWVTLACAVVILASAAVGYRRSRLVIDRKAIVDRTRWKDERTP